MSAIERPGRCANTHSHAMIYEHMAAGDNVEEEEEKENWKTRRRLDGQDKTKAEALKKLIVVKE